MTKEEFEKFKIVLPEPNRFSQLALTISSKGYVNLNGKLMERLGQIQTIGLYATDDGRELLLDPQLPQKKSFRLPKSGSFKAVRFIRLLAEKGIALPARYEVFWEEAQHMWHAVYTPLFENGRKALEKEIKKPRDKRVKVMLPPEVLE